MTLLPLISLSWGRLLLPTCLPFYLSEKSSDNSQHILKHMHASSRALPPLSHFCGQNKAGRLSISGEHSGCTSLREEKEKEKAWRLLQPLRLALSFSCFCHENMLLSLSFSSHNKHLYVYHVLPASVLYNSLITLSIISRYRRHHSFFIKAHLQ